MTKNNATLERVYKFKYLGVTLDRNSSWNEHIDALGNKISSRLGIIRKARKVLPRDACLTLFNATVLPLFDYCCVVWDACGQGNKNFLDRLYRRAASIIEAARSPKTSWVLSSNGDHCSVDGTTINACRFTNASMDLRQRTFLTTLRSLIKSTAMISATKTSSACR